MPVAKTTQAPKKPGTSEKAPDDFEDEIRHEAYCKYEWRCESHEPGSETEDWLGAEQVVLARHAAPTPKPDSTNAK